MNRAVLDYYRCPPEFVQLRPDGRFGAEPGYFRFGREICFGPTLDGAGRADPGDELADLQGRPAGDDRVWLLPFDPTGVADSLRNERYVTKGPGHESRFGRTVRSAYYMIRPALPVSVRKYAQRRFLSDWKHIRFPQWPVGTGVDGMMEQITALSLRSTPDAEMPFVWFWPKGYRGALIMTHDVEQAAGRDYCDTLMDLNDAHGLKSSFQIVPEERYAVSDRFLDNVRRRGFEVNVHGLNHDGWLFRDRDEFMRRAELINHYASQWNATGFRSPVLYRNQEWFDALDFDYDMSVPSLGHLEAQRGGCCTVMPFFIGDIVELPVTTTQDYSILHILKQPGLDLWREQTQAVLRRHGLISFIVHPDYIQDEPGRSLYAALLEYLREFCRRERIWVALPGEVARWWRRRSRMHVVRDGTGFSIAPDASSDARIAVASLDGDAVNYRIERRSGD